MKRIITITCAMIVALLASAQTEDYKSQNVLRANLLNPGIEYEFPLYHQFLLSTNVGFGYGGSYPNLDESSGNGLVYIYSPFLDIECKHLYNSKKRKSKGKNIEYNSGNYWGIRMLSRGKETSSNIIRTDSKDFSIGPVWGLQRAYGPVHLLFDLGMQYYFDTKGNSGFFPLTFQLNIGFNLKKF